MTTDYERDKRTESPIPEPVYDIATALFVGVMACAFLAALLGRFSG